MGPGPALEPREVKLSRFRFAGLILGLAVAVPRPAAAHGSEYVYARLALEGQPRLEISLEYTDNPVVHSREEALAILTHDLIVRCNGREWSIADLAPQPLWGEATVFPQSAPVPVPEPGDGSHHRLVTARIDLAGNLKGELQLSVKPGSEQAVIYWIEEPDGHSGPPRWKILLAGDTSPDTRR